MTETMIPVVESHIELDERGRPWIRGENVKVIEVIAEKTGWGWDADEIHRQHPNLSLSKIRAAFAYYYDDQPEMDAQIEKDASEAETARLAAISAGTQPTRAELERRLRATTEVGR